MRISRKAFKVWLSCTILWWVVLGVVINAGGFFPARYQTSFPLQPNLPVWQKDAGWQVDDPLRKPLYEIIRSPSAGKLPVQFEYRGYQGPIWNQHIHSRKTRTFEFASGETLDLPNELTEADVAYLKQAFWDQRWTRWWEILKPYLANAIVLPLIALAIIWGVRHLRIAITGKEPPPEAPRLPYSPQMERLRRITLAVGGAELLFWLVMAKVLDPRESYFDNLYAMFPAILPALAAVIMSVLYRGPIAAALLAALSIYLIAPLAISLIVI